MNPWHLRPHLERYLTPGYVFVWAAHAVVVARSASRSIRGRTGATAAGQAAARRPGSQGTLLVQDGVAAVGSTVRKPKPKQKNKGLGVGGDSNDHGLVSFVHSLEARLRAVEATTCSVVLVPRESSVPFKGNEGGWQEVRAPGVSQRPARARPGQPSPPRVHGPPVRAGRVRASAGRRPSSSELRRGRQNVAEAGHRAPDAGGNGRAGHDVSCGGLSRPAAAGETGTHPVCHERDHGSVVASA